MKPLLSPDYRPTEKESFMNPMQLEYFRQKLLAWKAELLKESNETLSHLQEESFFFKQKTAYEIGLGIPAEPLFRSLLFLNPQCLASISRWITASSSWKRFCLFVCR